MKQCFYAMGGINYKNGTVSCCPRQADQLVFQKDNFYLRKFIIMKILKS